MTHGDLSIHVYIRAYSILYTHTHALTQRPQSSLIEGQRNNRKKKKRRDRIGSIAKRVKPKKNPNSTGRDNKTRKSCYAFSLTPQSISCNNPCEPMSGSNREQTFKHTSTFCPVRRRRRGETSSQMKIGKQRRDSQKENTNTLTSVNKTNKTTTISPIIVIKIIIIIIICSRNALNSHSAPYRRD